MNQPTLALDADLTINDLVRLHPEALPVLQLYGLDACCGGPLPLAEAARRHGLALDELLQAVRAAIGAR
jgi:iron-sulfur cluster repair protein YtfE (RIC family)